MDSRPSSLCDPDLVASVSQVADEFAEELRAGRPPSVADYARRFPELETVLPNLLATVATIRDLGVPLEPHLKSGTLLGDFRIERELGRGGMGVVYEATQSSLNRRVALKVLPTLTSLSEPQLARFRIESQAAALLRHPHIVPIHAIGCEQNLNYYAMGLVDGPTLADWVVEVRRQLAHPESSQDMADSNIVRNASGRAPQSVGQVSNLPARESHELHDANGGHVENVPHA